MKFNKLKTALMVSAFGFLSAIALLFFVLRSVFPDIDIDSITPSLTAILLLLTVFFSIIFAAALLALKFVKKDFRKEIPFKYLCNSGLILQLISLFLILGIYCFPKGIYLLAGISIILLCLGYVLYRKTIKGLSLSFILWGTALLILWYLFTSISVSYWSN
jgi:hypothetical protein